MNDKYSRAIAYLKKHPEEIEEAWGYPSSHKEAGCLFRHATKTRNNGYVSRQNAYAGCLTTIKSGDVAQTKKLTEAIRKDERIPDDPANITLADLPVFAEWQRRLDKELKRS